MSVAPRIEVPAPIEAADVDLVVEPLKTFEKKYNLPGQFFLSSVYSEAPPHIQMMMMRFRPWHYYTDAETGKTPVRVLSIVSEDTISTVSVVQVDGTAYLNFNDRVDSKEVKPVETWSSQHLEIIKQLPNVQAVLFADRSGFGTLAGIAASFSQCAD